MHKNWNYWKYKLSENGEQKTITGSHSHSWMHSHRHTHTYSLENYKCLITDELYTFLLYLLLHVLRFLGFFRLPFCLEILSVLSRNLFVGWFVSLFERSSQTFFDAPLHHILNFIWTKTIQNTVHFTYEINCASSTLVLNFIMYICIFVYVILTLNLNVERIALGSELKKSTNFTIIRSFSHFQHFHGLF